MSGRPPGRSLALSCDRCSRTVATRVTEDPSGWPLHRCLGRVLAPFTSAAPYRVSPYEPMRDLLVAAGALDRSGAA